MIVRKCLESVDLNTSFFFSFQFFVLLPRVTEGNAEEERAKIRYRYR